MKEPFRYKPRREKLSVDDDGLLDMIQKLAFYLGLSKSHIADMLGVGRSTFYDFLKNNEEAMDAFRAGRAAGRLKFAQTGMNFAQIDPPTWRHLSKHKRFLGLSDEPVAAKKGDEVDAPGKVRLSREEAIARIQELRRKANLDIDGEATEVHTPANRAMTGNAIARRT